MKGLRLVVIFASLLPACGCVPLPSFYPLWDEQHAAFEPRLLGTWKPLEAENDEELRIVESKNKSYLMT
jgi:hypothetical protein